MLYHLLNFLERVLSLWFSHYGTSALGLLCALFSPTRKLIQRWKTGETMKSIWSENRFGVGLLLTLWLGLFIWCTGEVTYRDHQDLIARNKTLTSQIQQEKPGSAPDFQGLIQQRATGTIGGDTVLLLSVLLINRGASSVAIGWSLDIQFPSLPLVVIPSTAMEKTDYFFDKSGRKVSFFEQGSLVDKASQPIGRGSIASGWIKFVLRGKWQSQLRTTDSVMHLHFFDFTGKRYSLVFDPTSEPQSEPLKLLPGMAHH